MRIERAIFKYRILTDPSLSLSLVLSVRQKRLKRNRSLRKLLTPKNALMALYELKGNELSEFHMQSDEKGFVATVSVNGKDFSGRGVSKIVAKNDASEKALRDLIISKMQSIPKGGQQQQQQQTTSAGTSIDGDATAVDEASAASDEQEEVPMMHLASFALHKLFTEWQAEGYEIPDFRAGPVAAAKAVSAILVWEITTTTTVCPFVCVLVSHDCCVVGTRTPLTIIAPLFSRTISRLHVVQEPVKPTERKELPPNHEQLHPSMLLAIMRPQTQYIELGSEGTTPNVIHRIGVTVDGREFIGSARSKKAARKAAAIQACNVTFRCAYEADGGVAGAADVSQVQQQGAVEMVAAS